jgi:hypothetical protein
MESTVKQVNKSEQEVFSEETRQNIQAFLDEIDRKQQRSSSQQVTAGKTKYIKFSYDKEQKRLSFTGKCDKREVPAKDFESGQEIPDKYITRYSFECYDITNPDYPSELSIWERGQRDARAILFWLSKNKNVLDITRHGQPGSMATTYDIYPPMD